jgi:hypothetical protein
MRRTPRYYRALPASLLPMWFLAGVWLSAAQAQLHELPPSSPAPTQNLSYDANPKLRSVGASTSGMQTPYDSSGGLLASPGPAAPDALSAYDSVAPSTPGPYFGPNAAASQPLYYGYGSCWTWQLVPDGLMYPSYLAGVKEPRFASQWTNQRNHGWVWDSTLGGRVGIARLGTQNDIRPEGWQLDFEGAAFPRIDLSEGHDREFESADYRVGVPLTTRQGPWEGKFGYYHLSSHLGDEFLETHSGVDRINYVRDSLLLGVALRPHRDWRLYGEVGWAFHIDGGARPWEFQFGGEYSPAEPTGAAGAPFVAANGHLRQDNNFGGNVNVEAGWQWRGRSGHLFRVGAQFFDGMSEQYQFFTQHEDQVGVGLWYDF